MRIFLKLIPLLVLTGMFLNSCSGEGEQQAVDESYLDSEHYQEFDRQSMSEQSSRSDEATVFMSLMDSLRRSPDTRELSLPMEIDSLALEEFEKSGPKIELNQSMLNEKTEMDYVYYPVGKVQRGELELLFFLIQKQSVYYDKELAVATFRDTLVAVQSIGEFNKSLERQMQSTVRIDPSLTITSEIIRKAKYPVPQEFHNSYRYTINSKGEIEEEITSGGG